MAGAGPMGSAAEARPPAPLGALEAREADLDHGARIEFRAFDTLCAITAYGPVPRAREACRAAVARCRIFEGLFSRTLASSDIGRLNAAQGRPVAIDPRTAQVLTAALGYCQAGKGAFDITVGPYCKLWDFKRGIVPAPDQLAAAAPHVDWRHLSVRREKTGWVAQLRDPRAQVDLGGIAKGWIADELGELMMGMGLQGALADLGGNILARGSKPDGSPWRIAVRRPPGLPPQAAVPVVTLQEGSVVTSGTYERGFTKGPVRYHHILDPRTGHPVSTPAASATAVCRRSIDAEGFSTTLLALGPDGSGAVAAEHPELLQALFILDDGSVRALRPEAGA